MKHYDATKRTLKPKATEYLAKILAWQKETGKTGLPPVWHDKKLSNWVQFHRAQYKRGRLRPDLAYALSQLGVILCAPGESLCAIPRGLAEKIAAILAFSAAHRRMPRPLAPKGDERLLAYWLVRIQADILPRILVPAEPDAELLDRLDQLLEALDAQQPIRAMLADWHLFCHALQTCVDVGTAGDRWQQQLAVQQPSSVWASIGQLARQEVSMIESDLPLRPIAIPPPEIRDYLDHELQVGLRCRGRNVRDLSRLAGVRKPLWSIMLARLKSAGIERWHVFRPGAQLEDWWWEGERMAPERNWSSFDELLRSMRRPPPG